MAKKISIRRLLNNTNKNVSLLLMVVGIVFIVVKEPIAAGLFYISSALFLGRKNE